jgi:hypothetical protein
MLTARKSKFAAAAVAGIVLIGSGSTAFASATTPAGGVIHVFADINVKSQTVDPIFFTGVIGDYGTSTSTTKAGKVDPNGNYEKVVLKKGGFEINATALNGGFKPTVNRSTCSIVVSASMEPASVYGGTGLYQGISGALKLSGTFAGIFPRKANGTCNFNAQPVTAYGEITGAGKVKF